MSGTWIDLLLLLLLVGAIVALVRVARNPVLAADGIQGSGDADLGHDVRSWARGYYPRLVRQAGYDPEFWRIPYWVGKVFFAVVLAYLWYRFVTVLSETMSPLAGVVVFAIAGFFVPDAVFGPVSYTHLRAHETP